MATLPHDLERRLLRLEAESAIRACLTTYMELCDHLDRHTDLEALGSLFTPDCVWEGRGSRYGKTFGRHDGRAAIVAYLGSYCEPQHFAANAHFLSSERIAVAGDAQSANGRWMMLQTPTFHDGSSFLMAASLDIDFRLFDGAWRMAHFRTTNLYARPVADWNQPVSIPSPPVAAVPGARAEPEEQPQ